MSVAERTLYNHITMQKKRRATTLQERKTKFEFKKIRNKVNRPYCFLMQMSIMDRRKGISARKRETKHTENITPLDTVAVE